MSESKVIGEMRILAGMDEREDLGVDEQTMSIATAPTMSVMGMIGSPSVSDMTGSRDMTGVAVPVYSQEESEYVGISQGDKRCKGCKAFLPPSGCSKVMGMISQHGWCKFHDPAPSRDQDVSAPFRQYDEAKKKKCKGKGRGGKRELDEAKQRSVELKVSSMSDLHALMDALASNKKPGTVYVDDGKFRVTVTGPEADVDRLVSKVMSIVRFRTKWMK